MSKKPLNQNTKFTQDFIKTFETDFIFNNEPQNRYKDLKSNLINSNSQKKQKLSDLKNLINTIEDCNLKKASKNLLFGSGNINSSIMLIGDAPGEEEDESGLLFQGDVGKLLEKMLLAINVSMDNIYLTYSINYKTTDERKPNTSDIKRYSKFLKQHISIINPQMLILMGGTAMEAVTGLKSKISDERGKWKEIIIGSKTVPLMISYSPSYLIRFPENKKYSWKDLKMIKQKREKRVVGWKEHAALPDLNVKSVIAKIDTGATLASIDAADIKIVTRDKVKYVKFKVMKRNNTVRKTSAPLEGYKRIKSSNGDVERRPYIKTTLLMDGISKKIELTLTDRGPMDYTMLIGRRALGRRWVVNPSVSFLTKPKRE